MKVVTMGSTATLCTAAMSVCSAIDALGKGPNTTPPIRPGLAESFKVS